MSLGWGPNAIPLLNDGPLLLGSIMAPEVAACLPRPERVFDVDQ
jgi:hypothetical protein